MKTGTEIYTWKIEIELSLLIGASAYTTLWEEGSRKVSTSVPIWTTQWIQGLPEQVSMTIFQKFKNIQIIGHVIPGQ